MSRIQYSMKNLVYGGVNQAVSSVLSFASRYVLIHTLGLEAVSLNGLFTEVIAMLSLAEMGVGVAIVYNLYKPLREGDEEKLAQLMNLFKTAYRMIALTIFAIGLVLLPFVHLLVSRVDIDLWYLRLVYLLFLVQAASSYLFSYKNALVGADQKGYVVSQCSLAVRLTATAVSITLLVLTKNYIVYLLIQIGSTLCNNLLVSFRVERLYPLLKRRDQLPAQERKQVFSNIKYLFIGTLSGKITNSTDNILISTMVGTLHIGAYGCYTAIINAAKGLLIQIHNATTGSVGNLVAEGDNEKTELILRRLTFITACPAFFIAVGIYTVSTPFVRLLYGEAYVLPMGVVFVCVMNFFIYLIKNPLWSVMNVAGLFAQNKNISLIGDGLNLLVSIVLGRRLGIAGILLGTSCTLLVQHGLKTYLLFHSFLHLPARAYVYLETKETAVCLGCMVLAQAICVRLPVTNLYLQILCYGLCAVAVAAGVMVLLFHATPEYRYMVDTVRRLLGGWLRKKRTSECNL